MSYSDEDGSSFEGILPAEARSFDINIRFNTAGILPDGVMFLPTAMEDKWAIFLHRDKIIFVRSWLRDVFAIADVVKEPDNLYITRITGSFPEDMQLDDVTAMLRFLLISHVIGETCPAPVSREMAEHPIQAANTAFSLYGRHATIAVFSAYQAQTNTPLRTNTLLHIATARGDIDGIRQQLAAGIPVDCPGTDGMAPMYWALVQNNTDVFRELLLNGADIDTRTGEGSTPLMHAVQRKNAGHVAYLIASGANINAMDNRGFTALHRAAEMGLVNIVRLLLEKGADKNIVAQGETAMSLAAKRNEEEVQQLLN